MSAASSLPLPWPAVPEQHRSNIGFKAIFEHAPIAVALCDTSGLLVDFNPACERLLDSAGPLWRTQRLAELCAPSDRKRLQEFLRRESTSASPLEFELPERTSHGKIRFTACSSCAWPEHYLLFGDKERAAESPDPNGLQAQRWEAIGRLSGGVVHDFNNLLTGVMLYCDLLLSSLDATDRRRRYVDEIRSAITQAAGLVSQLLVFARPKLAPARPVSLNDVVCALCDLLGRLIGENIELALLLDPNLAPVQIDPSQAEQILLNLVLNARDALPNGGRITIETSNRQFHPLSQSTPSEAEEFPCVLLTVADNGEGMTTETRERLFEPFFTTKNGGRGTGLGLTTVRSIVTSHRGLIHFESAPGKGTRAMVLLPRALPASGNELSPAPIPTTPTQEGESRL